MILQTKVAVLAAKIAILSALMVLAGVMQLDSPDSGSRVLVGIGASAFVAMAGILYWDLRRAIANIARKQAENFADNTIKYEKFSELQQRLIGAMTMMPLIHASPEERVALIERIRQVLQS